jgi:uncharacterized protein (TIGR03435 family)
MSCEPEQDATKSISTLGVSDLRKRCMIAKPHVLDAIGIVAVLGGIVSLLSAQTPANPTFEVASIKPNKSIEGARGIGFQPGGRFSARNVRVRELIAAAYGTPQPLASFRIVGGPKWISADPFDVVAKAAENFPETQAQPGWSTAGELMLRELLADRFKLVVHRETRQLPIYALILATSNGRLGPQLRPSAADDCVDSATAVADPSRRCGAFRFTPPQRMSARGVTIDAIARFLEMNTVGRGVINRTGLMGTFSMDLEFTRDAAAVDPAVDTDRSADAAPSIFTAVQEQLGLKLESSRGPVDVLVIDRVEHPTED